MNTPFRPIRLLCHFQDLRRSRIQFILLPVWQDKIVVEHDTWRGLNSLAKRELIHGQGFAVSIKAHRIDGRFWLVVA